jgi:glycerol-3-phosphate dehydrogenase
MLTGAFERAGALRRLASTHFDVVVVGGGITGAGCALDAASRGLRVALVERDDFASGTSSKSSKLVHGGLRYLQHGEVRLVYEALLERQRLRRNAPHLVSTLPFLIPVLSTGGVIDRKLARALGSMMWTYDLTGGARIGRLHQRVAVDEALEHFPTLRRDRLLPSYVYFDARADDARLCLTVARTAAIDHGAVVVNRARLAGIERGTDGRVEHLRVVADGRELDVRTDAVINATGVWADEVRHLDDPGATDALRPAKGVHVTVPWHRLRNDIAAVLPVERDRRSVFVIPWGDFTFIGTTDTEHHGSLDDPTCTPEDVAYLLDAVNAATTAELTPADVTATWAGLRPLVADTASSSARTADLSRWHRVDRSPSGVVTITGGKLTTYREMAAETVDDVLEHVLGAPVLERAQRHSRTRRLRLRGAAGHRDLLDEAERASTLGVDVVRHLVGRYGGEARTVLAMAERDPDLAAPLVPGLPYLRAEAVYAVRYEMARSVDDVLSRRTRARLLARDDSAAAAADVAALIGPLLGWDATTEALEAQAYRVAVETERRAPHLPEVALETAMRP